MVSANAARRADRPAEARAVLAQLGADPAAVPGHADGRLASFMRTVERWLATRPTPLMAELLADTGLSRRQVERNCKALYGISPKALAREARALRAAAAMTANPDDDDFVAYGFYDQSHMIREVKYFTGMTPGQIRSAQRSRRATVPAPGTNDLGPRHRGPSIISAGAMPAQAGTRYSAHSLLPAGSRR
jgi:AraC-like DNA-binding protein